MAQFTKEDVANSVKLFILNGNKVNYNAVGEALATMDGIDIDNTEEMERYSEGSVMAMLDFSLKADVFNESLAPKGASNEEIKEICDERCQKLYGMDSREVAIRSDAFIDARQKEELSGEEFTPDEFHDEFRLACAKRGLNLGLDPSIFNGSKEEIKVDIDTLKGLDSSIFDKIDAKVNDSIDRSNGLDASIWSDELDIDSADLIPIARALDPTLWDDEYHKDKDREDFKDDLYGYTDELDD